MDDRTKIFIDALLVAKETVAALDRRISTLEKIKVQRENWLQFINFTEAILQGDIPLELEDLQPMFPEIAETAGITTAKSAPLTETDSLWKVIHLVLQIKKRPMTAAEILEEVLKTDSGAVRGENQRETVRSAMARKPDIFERAQRGSFVLREWPDRLKKA